MIKQFLALWCLVDALWSQLIKLIQVVSTSEFHEYKWNNIVFIFFVLRFLQGLRRTFTDSKTKDQNMKSQDGKDFCRRVQNHQAKFGLVIF